jgi:SAM-dependent methyltransferase
VSLSGAAKLTSNDVRDDFNDPRAMVHYARAAHFLGLWESERILIERFFPDRAIPLLEAGCGAGRVTLGLWHLGYGDLTAFDFAEELLLQARSLAAERGAAIAFLNIDATDRDRGRALDRLRPSGPGRAGFGGALFMFNGLMQIPGRENRRSAWRMLRNACAPGAPLIFTTHDREESPVERARWRTEADLWSRGRQDPRLLEFGDCYFENESGRVFMHLPDRAEILADLDATGWTHEFDASRRDIAVESRAVLDFADECRFWVARKPLDAQPEMP